MFGECDIIVIERQVRKMILKMTKKEYLEYTIEKLKNGEYKIDEVEKIKKLIEHHQKILDKLK